MPNQDKLLREQEEIAEIDGGSPILGAYVTNFLIQAQKIAEQYDKRVLFYSIL